MGKTSLATAVIHHDEVVTKYQQQYFVGCHSAATCNELVAGILSHIGLEKGPGMSRRIIHHFQLSPPSLLVLDNLETVWEPDSSRKEVEDFLSLLADVPHLAIVVSHVIPLMLSGLNQSDPGHYERCRATGES
jgi:hypothetical protein